VLLVGLEGMSYDEAAAKILRAPIGTMRSRLVPAHEAPRLLMGIDEDPGALVGWRGGALPRGLARGCCFNHLDGTRCLATWRHVGLELRDGVSE
jgi:hypothetical protein